MAWAAFEYREFYDLPRSILLQIAGAYYYLESRFDEERDDYSEYYEVYRLPQSFAPESIGPSWTRLATIGTRLGRVPCGQVRFDDTRRRLIDDGVIGLATRYRL